MTPQKLHNIVNGLSKGQKITFRNWVNCNIRDASDRKKPLYILLYERLLRVERYDEKLIRGKEFKSAKVFLKYREMLFEKLLQSLAASLDTEGQILSQIKVSLALGAISHAKRVFSNELLVAYRNGRFEYSKVLISYRDTIFNDYRIDIFDGSKGVALPVIRESSVLIDKLAALHQKAITFFHKPFIEKSDIIDKVKECLATTVPSNGIEGYWHKKLEFDFHYLSGEYASAHKTQLEIGFGLESGQIMCRTAQEIREVASCIISSLHFNDRNEISRFSMILSAWKPANALDKRLKIRQWVMRTIEAGNILMDNDFGTEGFDQLKKNHRSFSNSEVAKYSYYSALTFLSIGNFSKGLECIREIEGIPGVVHGELSWQPDVLKAILFFELGEIDLCENTLRSAKRRIGSMQFKFPQIILDSISFVQNAQGNSEITLYRTDVERQLANLALEVDEARQMKFFDLSLWLRSKDNNSTMAECSVGNDKEKWNPARLASG